MALESPAEQKGEGSDPERLQRPFLSVASQELNVSWDQAKLLLQVQKTNTISWRGRCARWETLSLFF